MSLDNKVDEVIDEISEKKDETLEKIEEDIQDLKSDVEDKISDTEDQIKDENDKLVNDVQSVDFDESKTNEISDNSVDTISEDITTAKKKGTIHKPIIIAGIIVVAAVLAFLVYYFFFHTTIVNAGNSAWEFKATDGYTYYYTFSKDGKSIMSLGSIDFVGEYQISKEEVASGEECNVITISQYYGEITGSYSFKIEGSKITGSQVLTLTPLNGNGTGELVLKQSSKPSLQSLIKKNSDAKIDENIIGDWVYTFEDYGLNYSFSFTKDGIMTINQYDSIIYNGFYSAENGKISYTFFTTEENTQDIDYSCDGNTLNILDLVCTRANAATSNQVANK